MPTGSGVPSGSSSSSSSISPSSAVWFSGDLEVRSLALEGSSFGRLKLVLLLDVRLVLPGRVAEFLLTPSPEAEMAALADVLALVTSATFTGSMISPVTGKGELGALGVSLLGSSVKGGMSAGTVSALTLRSQRRKKPTTHSLNSIRFRVVSSKRDEGEWGFADGGWRGALTEHKESLVL